MISALDIFANAGLWAAVLRIAADSAIPADLTTEIPDDSIFGEGTSIA